MKDINLKGKSIIVTGAAGFIGANLVLKLLRDIEDITIIGIDNMNDYYDVSLKEYRLYKIREQLNSSSGTFQFIKADIADKAVVEVLFSIYQPDVVVNLAAQAGVRYSIVNPDAYIESNLKGFYNILEGCRHSYSDNKIGRAHV